MKLHRFIGQFDLTKKEVQIKDQSFLHQMTRVLRFQKGDTLILGDGNGRETIGQIKKISSSEVVVLLQEVPSKKKELVSKISLYLSLLKKENFEWVAQKATEIGIAELIPISTTRVVKQNISEDRVRKIIKEAAEQSGRKVIPELLPTISLGEACVRSRDSGARWFLDQEGKSINQTSQTFTSVSIFIGPEGGWTEKEKEEAKKASLASVAISPFTLRAETAAITASYLATLLAQKRKSSNA